METSLIVGFFLLTVPAFFTPGPNNLMLMMSAAKFGIARTLPHALGIIFGFPLMVFCVGLGLGEVFTYLPFLQDLLKYVAAVYFLWMAWQLLGFKFGTAEGQTRPLTTLQAALFQWINPKAWAMAASFVAAFVGGGEQNLGGVLLLTFGCLLLAPFSSLIWMVFGERVQMFLTRTGTERFLGLILATLMVAAVVMFLL